MPTERRGWRFLRGERIRVLYRGRLMDYTTVKAVRGVRGGHLLDLYRLEMKMYLLVMGMMTWMMWV
jgi:hypothetical protein